jgi:NAD(P) transhydrogenase subunit alpha
VKIVVPKEIIEGETRVALIPSVTATLVRGGHELYVQEGAGQAASFSDDQYAQAGAKTVSDASSLYNSAEIVVKVRPPEIGEVNMMPEGTTYVGFLAPLDFPDIVQAMAKRGMTAFSMEYVPRISRAQGMDALSSMATVAGYKAVLLATERLGKMFPLLMTAAGTVPPAIVLVLGAGVAGLQAIATAKRLGANVEAFDPRPAVKEQVQSLGAAFVEMELPEEDVETAGGYAKELSPEFIKKEMEAISARLPRVNVVVTTAQVFGKRAPILITEDMVKQMKPGSVIVDIAAEQGGNCELTEAGKIVEKHGVTVIGTLNLPGLIPIDASLMYSKNVLNLLQHLYPGGEDDKPQPDFEDEITQGACIIKEGAIVNEMVKNALEQGAEKK